MFKRNRFPVLSRSAARQPNGVLKLKGKSKHPVRNQSGSSQSRNEFPLCRLNLSLNMTRCLTAPSDLASSLPLTRGVGTDGNRLASEGG